VADGKEPTGGDAGAGSAGAAEPRFTQADLDRIVAKERRKFEPQEKALAEMQAKLAAADEAKKTEFEKAIETAAKRARAEADAEWSGKLTAQQVDSELRGRLRDRGYDADLAHVVKAKATIGSVDDIDSAIDSALGDKWKPEGEPEKPKPHQVGAPTGGGARRGAWTEESIQAFVANNPRALTREIEAEMKRDLGMS
jgi:hypothetical protein